MHYSRVTIQNIWHPINNNQAYQDPGKVPRQFNGGKEIFQQMMPEQFYNHMLRY